MDLNNNKLSTLHAHFLSQVQNYANRAERALLEAKSLQKLYEEHPEGWDWDPDLWRDSGSRLFAPADDGLGVAMISAPHERPEYHTIAKGTFLKNGLERATPYDEWAWGFKARSSSGHLTMCWVFNKVTKALNSANFARTILARLSAVDAWAVEYIPNHREAGLYNPDTNATFDLYRGLMHEITLNEFGECLLDTDQIESSLCYMLDYLAFNVETARKV